MSPFKLQMIPKCPVTGRPHWWTPCFQCRRNCPPPPVPQTRLHFDFVVFASSHTFQTGHERRQNSRGAHPVGKIWQIVVLFVISVSTNHARDAEIAQDCVNTLLSFQSVLKTYLPSTACFIIFLEYLGGGGTCVMLGVLPGYFDTLVKVCPAGFNQ